MDKMKAIVWDGNNYPEGLSLREFESPVPPPGWVLVKNKIAGICGSDLHYITGITRSIVPDENLPAVLGHEDAGVVVEVGEGVVGLEPGDRVAAEPLHGCGEMGKEPCPMCRIGQYHLCEDLTHVGIPIKKMLPGGYGEYSIFHASRLFKMPHNVSFEEAALLDVLAVGVHAVKLVRPSMGDSAVVLGCGVIGIDMIQCLKVEGVSGIIGVAKYPFQAEAALKAGAKHVVLYEPGVDVIAEVRKLAGGGVDQVYECVGGNSDAIQQGIDMCRWGGQVVMLGVFGGNRPINLLTMLLKEVDIISSNSYSSAGHVREYQIALDLLANGQAKHDFLITHRYGIEDWKEALNVAMNRKENECLKVVFVHQ